MESAQCTFIYVLSKISDNLHTFMPSGVNSLGLIKHYVPSSTPKFLFVQNVKQRLVNNKYIYY